MIRKACFVLLIATLGPMAAAFEPQGLYLMTRIFGSSIEMKTWYFRGDRFAQEPVGDIAAFDFAAAERSAPGTTGTLRRNGDDWTFRWVDGRAQNARYQPGTPAGVCYYWNAGLFCPVKKFSGRQTLDGRYSGSLGGGGVGSARSYEFRRDGTYTLDSSGSVLTSGAYAGQGSRENGRYQISGNTLTLQPASGAARRLVTFPYESGADPAQPDRFYAGGFMLKRNGPATATSAGAPAASAAASASTQSTPAGALPACPDTLPAGTANLVCQCSAESTTYGAVWGTDTYTADSRLCRAAMHAGVIGSNGGPMRARAVAGQASYAGSTRNGITSASWGSWPGAFVVSKP